VPDTHTQKAPPPYADVIHLNARGGRCGFPIYDDDGRDYYYNNHNNNLIFLLLLLLWLCKYVICIIICQLYCRVQVPDCNTCMVSGEGVYGLTHASRSAVRNVRMPRPLLSKNWERPKLCNCKFPGRLYYVWLVNDTTIFTVNQNFTIWKSHETTDITI